MLRGLYSAAAGMSAQQQRMDALANDVANVNTAGYKHVRVAMRDLVYTEDAGGRSIGAGSAASIAGRGFAQGSLRNTGRSLDVAIQGEGFIAVRRPDGTRALTRDGALSIDANGRLVTSTGALLDPAITLPKGTNESDVAIGRDGAVLVGTKQVGQIRIVDVRSPENLLAEGDNAFSVTAASGPARAAASASLTQGALEGSNVDMAESMVDMMQTQTAFSLASKAIQVHDQMWEIANGVKR